MRRMRPRPAAGERRGAGRPRRLDQGAHPAGGPQGGRRCPPGARQHLASRPCGRLGGASHVAPGPRRPLKRLTPCTPGQSAGSSSTPPLAGLRCPPGSMGIAASTHRPHFSDTSITSRVRQPRFPHAWRISLPPHRPMRATGGGSGPLRHPDGMQASESSSWPAPLATCADASRLVNLAGIAFLSSLLTPPSAMVKTQATAAAVMEGLSAPPVLPGTCVHIPQYRATPHFS
jgi:hypothetical protein